MTARLATAAVLSLTLPLGAAGAQPAAESAFVDRVATLALDGDLDSRGNLGGVTVDRLGFLYVANFRDAVWRISPDGEVHLLTRSLYGASGNAVDSHGDLFQANFYGDTITRITRAGEVSRFVGQGLDGPVGLAFAADGDLFVCNCTGNYLARVTPAGEVSVLARSERFACPNGIAIGPDGDLYVTNFNHHDILRVAPGDGSVELFATVPGGAGNAHIAFAKGFFYVTKIFAHRVVRLSLAGDLFPFAGTGTAGHDDGPALEASLASPNGIAVAPGGDRLYVNTLIGEFRGGEPASITVRTIEPTTLTKVLDAARAAGGLEAVAAAYERYRRDPVRGQEDTIAEMIAYGYRLLSARQIAAALQIFSLNAETHSDSPPAQYQLGEAYRYAGRTDDAIGQYRKTLALDPEHAQAKSRLVQVGASD